MVEVFLLRLGEDYHIVQVDQGIRQVQLAEAILHEPLECCQSITEPVRHSQKLIHPHTTDRKGGVLLGVLGHLDLPKTRFQVHGGEELGAYHGLHGLLHPGKGVHIFLGPAVQSSEVNAEPETPILFTHSLSSVHLAQRWPSFPQLKYRPHLSASLAIFIMAM